MYAYMSFRFGKTADAEENERSFLNLACDRPTHADCITAKYSEILCATLFTIHKAEKYYGIYFISLRGDAMP